MNNNNPLSAAIDETLIRQWKAKYPSGIFELSISGFKAFLRLPTDREAIDFCSRSNKLKGRSLAKSFIKLIWLGGDREIIDNDQIFDETELELVKLVKIKEQQMNRRNNFYF